MYLEVKVAYDGPVSINPAESTYVSFQWNWATSWENLF